MTGPLKLVINSSSRNIVLNDDSHVKIKEWRPEYDGPYTITPSSTQRVLHVAGMDMTSDITINPIPSNYGLVTWDGSILTIS